jgi:sigma-E factor negative regulatory protein RseC
MIKQLARVTALEDEFVWLEVMRQSSCQSCAASAGCGTASIDRMLGDKRTKLRALRGDKTPKVGASVTVGIPEQSMLQTATRVYLWPLVGLIFGAWYGTYWGHWLGDWMPVDGSAVVAGILGAIIAWCMTLRFMRRVSHDPDYQPRLIQSDHKTELEIFVGISK